jgi:hypothetical protein
MTANIIISGSQYERRLISQRTRDALAAKRDSRVILDSLASQIRSGKLGRKPASLQRPAWGP